jgi:hypothetical protein
MEEYTDLNKLTLAMFSNKGMYKKHLERSDPETYEKKCKYLSNIRKYRQKMSDLTTEFLENPEKDFNTEVNEMFEMFSNTLIRYIQMKDMDENENGDPGCYESHTKNGKDNDGDDDDGNDDENDTLFTTSKSTKYYSKNRLANFFEKL